MNLDSEALSTALKANIEYPPETEQAYDSIIFRFGDTRLRYEMHIHPNTGTAFLAMDPKEPMQACPMLEFSFCCTDVLIEKSSYDGDGVDIAIRFYEGEVSPAGQRLTITWIPDGYWYIWANATANPNAENGG